MSPDLIGALAFLAAGVLILITVKAFAATTDEPPVSEPSHGGWIWSPPEIVHHDDAIVYGPRWRKALQEIADADPVDMVLDPTWSQRIARASLEGGAADA